MDTSSTDLKAIMRRDERRRGMLGDPDLTGDTLLLALESCATSARLPQRANKRPTAAPAPASNKLSASS